MYWLPTPFTSFPFTSPPLCHRVPSHFNWTLPDIYRIIPCRFNSEKAGLEFQELKKEWLHFYTFCLKYCLVLITKSGEPLLNFSGKKSVNCSACLLLLARICWPTSNTAASYSGSASWPDRGTGTDFPFILSLLSFLTNLQFLWPHVRVTCSSSQNKI